MQAQLCMSADAEITYRSVDNRHSRGHPDRHQRRPGRCHAAQCCSSAEYKYMVVSEDDVPMVGTDRETHFTNDTSK